MKYFLDPKQKNHPMRRNFLAKFLLFWAGLGVGAILYHKQNFFGTAAASQPGLQIWWPSPAVALSGRQPFKAMLENTRVEDYHMFWLVDGGQWNYMPNNYQDYPHKEADVDLSGWNWRGNGPYKITFKAVNFSGNVIGENNTTIYLNQLPSTNTQAHAPAVPVILTPTPTVSEAPRRPEPEPVSNSLYAPPRPQLENTIAQWRGSRPNDARELEKISSQPTALWYGNWNNDIERTVKSDAENARKQKLLPVMVAYNIPQRDCGNYSAGGAAGYDQYKEWIKQFSAGLSNLRAMVILEPDALSLTDCLDERGKASRMELLKYAVKILKQNSGISVYLDAGHPGWVSADEMAKRLAQAGVDSADGFSLNVSNFVGTEENIRYGQIISEKLGGAHFVIDTGRSGAGTNGQWCNPQGRSLGEKPTLKTGNGKVDAFLWVKPPGESDGNCNGGPSAGTFWADYALGLAQRSGY